jgi:hypothetical protein
MKPITFISEHPREWASAVDQCDTLTALLALCEDWKELVPDALRVVQSMTQHDFAEFREGLAKERRRHFAGEVFAHKYSDITMPAIMFKIAMFAGDYKVPWGTAYLRLKETGLLPKEGPEDAPPPA